MVEQTPRLDLDTYSEGESWDHTDTVEAVDEHSIVHGPIADRPASGEYDDELYHATDQNITWRWDSSASDWAYFSGQGSSGTPVPGTSHFESATIAAASIEDATIDGVEAPYATDPHDNDAHSVSYSVEGHTHSSYLLVDGSSPMEAALPMDDFGINDIGAVSETETITVDAGSSYEIDLSVSAVHKITLTADCTISFSGTDAATSNSATLIVEQDGTGGHSVTWPSGVLWPNGNEPLVTSDASAIDRFAFTYIDGDWYGSEAGSGFE